MKFTHYDLKQQKRVRAVRIHLSGSAANVRLMDSSNLSQYRNGRDHRYYGGLAKRSPCPPRRTEERALAHHG